jgi:hypothetical protein
MLKEFRKYTQYAVIIFTVYTLALGLLGYFRIGLLSDDYLNFSDAINSTFEQKLSGTLPFTNAFHIRPLYYLSLEKSVAIHDWFGFAEDNFVFYRVQNLLLMLFLAFASGLTVFHLTRRTSVSLVTFAAVLLFPNNINNICWIAARIDIICSFFYILTIYLYLLYHDSGKKYFGVLGLVTFFLALMTKELAISLPFIALLIGYFLYGRKDMKKTITLPLLFIFVLVLYFAYRIFVLGSNILDITTLYQSTPLANAPGVLARGFISLTIPLDYLELNYMLRNNTKIVLPYLFILYGSLGYLAWAMVKSQVYRSVSQILAIIFLLLLPHMIVGYIRPQMILLPFTVVTIFMMYIYNTQRNVSLKLNRKILKSLFFAAMLFWIYWSAVSVMNWETSYEKAKINVDNLLKLERDTTKKLILIGNPGRFKQTFMFDKMTGAFNFWKTKKFIINDTINDIVQTAAIEESSIGSVPVVKQLSPSDFEIRTSAPKHFFYIEGMDNERIRTGFINNDISVEFLEFNNVDKPIRFLLKIRNSNVECYIAENLGFRKLY